MKRPLLLVAALCALGALLWLMQRSADTSKPSAAPDGGGLAVAVPGSLPAFDAAPPVKDAGAPDAAWNGAYARANGAFGLPPQTVDEGIAQNALASFWKRVPGPTPTFRSERKVTVSLVVEDGRVAGARLELPKDGTTADLMAASPLLTGDHCGLEPSGMALSTAPHEPVVKGQFECNGKTIYYKGTVAFDDARPRPIAFDYRLEPFE